MAEVFRVLVTGANSGLGFATCCRLIDEFIYTRDQSEHLVLAITTRDQAKSDDTVRRLREHIAAAASSIEDRGMTGFGRLLQSRISFEPERLDLTSLRSVRALAERRKTAGTHFNALIFNAGVGGWTGLNWPYAIWSIMTDLVYAATYPPYKIGQAGGVTKPQLPRVQDDKTTSEPGDRVLGQVFCSNVFGHYMLGHYLAPLLAMSGDGRIIWVSSCEAYARCFSCSDLQGLKNVEAYEGTKRLTDILALTSELPETSHWVEEYLSVDPATNGNAGLASSSKRRVRTFVSHPGICATGIFPLPWILSQLMVLTFYVARWLGSPWHPITAYKGACAPVWLALLPADSLRDVVGRAGPGKWGSATDRSGDEKVERTEVEGWGYGGVIGDADGKRRGRMRGAKSLTKEDREAFVELGRQCWSEMESLRKRWEQRLQAVPADGV